MKREEVGRLPSNFTWRVILAPVLQWPSLSFAKWSGGAGRFACCERFYWRGKWTPFCWNWKRFGFLGLYKNNDLGW
mgnify:FL=1